MNRKIMVLVLASLITFILVFYRLGQADSNLEDMVASEYMNEESSQVMDELEDKDMAKDFTLKNIDGKDVSLSALEGEKLYIKFWASWCSICLSGLEELDVLSLEEDFRVISIVSPDYNSEKNTEDFKEWFKNQETKNLEVLLDEGGTVTKAYGIRAYPSSVYISSDGVLVKLLPGHSSNDTIRSFFEAID